MLQNYKDIPSLFILIYNAFFQNHSPFVVSQMLLFRRFFQLLGFAVCIIPNGHIWFLSLFHLYLAIE